jgi:hypothetical protein
MGRFVRIAGVAVVLAASTVVIGPAAASGSSWTKITGPSGPGQPLFQLYNNAKSAPPLTLSGTASSDITAVNIYCFADSDTHLAPNTALNALPVDITAGKFTVTGVLAPADACILRAIPTSYSGLNLSGDNAGYVDNFAGPAYYPGIVTTVPSATRLHLWVVSTNQQRALDSLGSPDVVSVGVFPWDSFTETSDPVAASAIALELFSGAVTDSTAYSQSSLIIDGKNVYLPDTLSNYLVSPDDGPASTFSVRRTHSGNVVVADTEPLRSCQGDVYPQTAGSCTPVATGVDLERSIVTSVQGAVLTVRDRFVSIDHARHSLSVDYSNSLVNREPNSAAVKLPGGSLRVQPTGSTSHLPAGAHTILITSDINAVDDAPDVNDVALTYSGKPDVIFGASTYYGLNYKRTIAKNGFSAFSFGIASGYSMADVAGWSKPLVKALTEHLLIHAPRHGAHVKKSATITGTITNPVNGYPTSVTITGGRHAKHAAVSLSGTWKATVKLKPGRHTIEVKATDPSGTKLHASVRVHAK